MKKAQGVQRIHWVFRCNAPSQDVTLSEDDRLPEYTYIIGQLLDHVEAYAFQLESAPDTGYLHYQGFIQFTNRRRKTWILKNIHPFEFVAPMKGTPKQAWNYATKTETRIFGPWIFGQPATLEVQKKLEEYVEACQAGQTDLELWHNFPSHMARLHNVPTRIRALQKPIRTDPLEVYVFYGPPGTGKSGVARALFPDLYTLPFSQKVWLTPRGHLAKEILFEDFSGEMFLKQFNRLLDRYPEEVEIKNGFLWYLPTVIIITTNVLPQRWYKSEGRQDVLRQVLRRITRCYDFTDYSFEPDYEPNRKIPPSMSPEDLFTKHTFNDNFIM